MLHYKPHDPSLWHALFDCSYKEKSEPNPRFGFVCTGDITLIPPFPSTYVQLSSWILQGERHWHCQNFYTENKNVPVTLLLCN